MMIICLFCFVLLWFVLLCHFCLFCYVCIESIIANQCDTSHLRKDNEIVAQHTTKHKITGIKRSRNENNINVENENASINGSMNKKRKLNDWINDDVIDKNNDNRNHVNSILTCDHGMHIFIFVGFLFFEFSIF